MPKYYFLKKKWQVIKSYAIIFLHAWNKKATKEGQKCWPYQKLLKYVLFYQNTQTSNSLQRFENLYLII